MSSSTYKSVGNLPYDKRPHDDKSTLQHSMLNTWCLLLNDGWDKLWGHQCSHMLLTKMYGNTQNIHTSLLDKWNIFPHNNTPVLTYPITTNLMYTELYLWSVHISPKGTSLQAIINFYICKLSPWFLHVYGSHINFSKWCKLYAKMQLNSYVFFE